MTIAQRSHRIGSDGALTLMVLGCLAAGPAAAVDGVVEISQAAALEGGITAGDAPGFPVEITESGSYVLTTNLSVPAGTTGISVLAAGSINMNGFSIVGPITCTGAPPSISCSGGPAVGIGASGTVANSVLRNGTISGFGFAGVLGFNRVEGVSSRSNSGPGFTIGGGSIISGCTAELNSGNGIEAGLRSLAIDNVVVRNGGAGIVAGSSAQVSRNTLSANGFGGISAAGGSSVTSNTIYNNVLHALSLNPTAAGFGDNTMTSNNGNSAGSDTNPETVGGYEIAPNLCGSDLICP